MDKRWRNMLVLVVALIAALGAYYQYFAPNPSPPADEKFVSIELAWRNAGIKADNFQGMDFEKVAGLSQAELNRIKADLAEVRASAADGKTIALAGVYISMIDFVESSKMVDEKNSAIDKLSLSEPCGGISLLKERNLLDAQKLEKLENFSGSANKFVSDYPGEAEKLGLARMDAKIAERRAELELRTASVNSLENDCG